MSEITPEEQVTTEQPTTSEEPATSEDSVTPPLPPATVSIDDILGEHDVIAQKEVTDRAELVKIGETTPEQLRPALIAWAKDGCPAAHRLFSVSVTPPPVCSDGVTREFFPYVEYVLGAPVHSYMVQLQAKLVGMTLSYSINSDTKEIAIHVTKKQ
jgi:hypothetical protein